MSKHPKTTPPTHFKEPLTEANQDAFYAWQQAQPWDQFVRAWPNHDWKIFRSGRDPENFYMEVAGRGNKDHCWLYWIWLKGQGRAKCGIRGGHGAVDKDLLTVTQRRNESTPAFAKRAMSKIRDRGYMHPEFEPPKNWYVDGQFAKSAPPAEASV